MMRWISILSVGLLAISPLVSGCDRGTTSEAAPAKRTPPKHVILISIDTLRSDRLGCYGYDRNTSPNIDAFAAESVLFATTASQSAQTLVSHKSILTGKRPLRIVRETTNADVAKLASLKNPRKFVENTFANMKSLPLVYEFQAAGYRTAAFTDGRWMTREMNFDAGFYDFNDEGGHFEKILPRAHEWLEHHGAERFFLFLHTYDTHCPYHCREPYNSLFCKDHSRHIPLAGKCGKPGLVNMELSPADITAINDHYDGGIASVDAYLGDFFDKLRVQGLYDEALIVVTSDHGESLGTHDQIGHGGLYLEQLLVPLIIKYPASWSVAPREISNPVELLNLMPTLLDACGIKNSSDIDGQTLAPLLNKDEWNSEYLIAQITYNEGRSAITNPAKRAILYPGRKLLIHDAKAPSVEIFDLLIDPSGQTLYSESNPDVAVDLMARLYESDLGASPDAFVSPEEANMSAELIQQLRALGYIGDDAP
jgi:arylsulfatase A-like enzyme